MERLLETGHSARTFDRVSDETNAPDQVRCGGGGGGGSGGSGSGGSGR
jgi:hypothetical protein